MKSNSDSMPRESYNVNSFAQCDGQTFITVWQSIYQQTPKLNDRWLVNIEEDC